jgi:TolB-like protein
MPDVFLSYSREDQAIARRFAQALEQEGFSVWWDQTLTAGEAFDKVTEQALQNARAVVVLWSKHSVDSRWVRAEAAQADENGTLVPVLIEPCTLPIQFKLTQTADLSGWGGEATDSRWQGFVTGLRRSQGKSSPPATSSTPVPAARRMSPAGWLAGALSVLALAAVVAWFLHRSEAHPEVFAGAPAAVSAAPTLAVLPFADLSPGKDQESFADGMTEEILNSLASLSGLQVTGRTSSFYFKGRNEPLQSIGQQLGVNFLLEGSVRKQGEELRITAQLIKAADGFHLWSQTYDRATQDIFSIQEDIARSVAEALQVALGVGDLGARPGMTRDVQAYELYMEGQGLMTRLTLEGYQQAAGKFEAALRRDPEFIRAWFGAWDANMTAWSLAGWDERLGQSLRDRAEALRAEIIRRFPGERWVQDFIRGTGELAQGDWITQAQRNIEAAGRPELTLAAGQEGPGSVTSAGVSKVRLDKSREAIADLEQARRRDPLNPNVLVYLPEAYANAERPAEALAENDRAWKATPSPLTAANGLIIALGTGQDAQIRERLERVLSLEPGSNFGRLHALQGRPEELRAELNRLVQQQPRGPASQLALVLAAYGAPDMAFQVLREDQDLLRRPITVLALWRPVMRDVRGLPGFKDLVRDWGLVDYWKVHGWGDHCKPVGTDDFECH